jgi:[protein-PII] uridylyltransferase
LAGPWSDADSRRVMSASRKPPALVQAVHYEPRLCMKVLWKKIAEHADRRLPTRSGSREQDLPAFKSFLRLESERLRMCHRSGAVGYDIVQARSYLVDVIVQKAFELASTEVSSNGSACSNLAVIALGGYGRGELAPFSDIDLLFLHNAAAGSRPHDVLQYLLYLLWDLGLTLGHCYRTSEECVELAKRDLVSRNALIEARFLTGNRALFDRLIGKLSSSWFGVKRQRERYLRELEAELLERHSRSGASGTAGEPNIKESAGGLRDIHTVLWLSHVAFGCRHLGDLVEQGRVSPSTLLPARSAYDFLLRLRNELHFRTGRRSDQLALDLQASIAAGLGYTGKNGEPASELMMHDYYSSAHRVRTFTFDVLGTIGKRPSQRGLFAYLGKKQVRDGFEISSGEVRLSPRDFDRETDPIWMIKAFEVAQESSACLSPGLLRTMRNQARAINREFRALPQAARIFRQILGRKHSVSPALRSMQETGFLPRFLPEFGRSSFRVSRHWNSQCTVAEHCLTAVEQLEKLVAQEPAGSGSTKVGRPITADEFVCLALALLIGDCTRAEENVDERERISARVAKRLGLDDESSSTLGFLLKHGRLMARLAQTRDCREDRVVQEFSRCVGDVHRLDLLFLLVLAEATAEPQREGAWGKSLLAGLYERSRALLQPRPGLPDLPDSPDSRVNRHLTMLPDHYLKCVSAELVRTHVSLIECLVDGDLAVEWQAHEEAHHSELAICTRDFPGLFAKLAGSLTAQDLDILSADLFTREDGIALDLFRIRRRRVGGPVGAEATRSVERALRAAVKPDFNVEQEVARWRKAYRLSFRRGRPITEIRPSVRFDSATSAQSTIIEVRAEDRPGLAYLIARTIAQLKIDIQFARITTERLYALDVFYVRGAQGAKLSSSEVETAERHLLAALEKTED